MRRLTFSIEADDWVWLCEMLAEVRRQPDLDDFSREDIDHVLRCLTALEGAV